ncbi:MAG: TolC family protein [Rhodocyclaceae bacterium]|nr:TolC family protein [Rhodocyclaceae bacterium]
MLLPAYTAARPSRRHGLLLAVLLGLASSAFAQSLTFQKALATAVSDTPALRANAAQVDAARYSVTPAGELPDPKLALGIDNLPIQGQDRYSLTKDSMTMQRIGISQDIPNGAKRDARIAAANGRVELAEAQTRVTRLTVLRETATAWITRNTVEQQLARIDALVGENSLLANAVRAQLAGGKGSAADAVMPRQEAAMIEERRDELAARRQQAVAALKRWLGSDGELPLAGDPPDWNLSRDGLAHTLHQHPELALFEPRTKVLDAELAEAKAGKRPDWGVDVAYQKRAPEFGDMVSVQLRLDLPVFSGSRQDPQIAARQAERTALDAEREATLREHIAMLDADWADYQRLSNASKRQRDILLPLAEEKVRLTTAAWRGGKGMLADVITARRERIDTELKAIAVEGERQQMAVRLHYAYGDVSGEQQ